MAAVGEGSRCHLQCAVAPTTWCSTQYRAGANMKRVTAGQAPRAGCRTIREESESVDQPGGLTLEPDQPLLHSLLYRPAYRARKALMMLCVAGLPAPALADSCKSEGRLIFVGTTSDSMKSVWLSATGPGSFNLEAAQGSQVVDEWTKQRKGLHISASPVVSNGNGGTHKLNDVSDSKPCLIDSQNQKGGLTIPPNISLPSLNLPGGRPGRVRRSENFSRILMGRILAAVAVAALAAVALAAASAGAASAGAASGAAASGAAALGVAALAVVALAVVAV